MARTTKAAEPREAFALRLRDAGDPLNRPAARRLAMGLKFLLRACALRCEHAVAVKPSKRRRAGKGPTP